MIINYKDAKAQAVLCIVAALDPLLIRNSITEPYLNGREQGYSLYHNGHRVVWSENRNSDSFVVYEGTSFEFSLQGNAPSEEIYKNKKLFDTEAYLEVAKYIIQILKGHD